MRSFLTLITAYVLGVGVADAAVRDTTSISRNATPTTIAATARTATSDIVSRVSVPAASSSRANATVRTRTGDATMRTGLSGLASRSGTRMATRTTTTARAATSRATTTGITRTHATPAPRDTSSGTGRNARAATNRSRAATGVPASASLTFGTGYTECRDAYFTCMDQFCATQNDSYRRCVCSSRLAEIQTKERALGQTATQIQDFKDLNIEVIPKTAAEVNAMLTASAGEKVAANARDKSASAQTLAGISDVLAGAKSKALSTAGTLDIAGDINAIWATTDLASGVNIANLTGEALYNAVHAQCTELIADSCTSNATLNMVVAAYGMYIENDCTTLATALGQKKNQADGTIRQTEREMNLARLDNYDAHNSTPINDCIAQVRADITADTACGTNYVHCLDVTGRYLNRDTGAPIYTAEFYQLDGQISLDGDILTNNTNRLIVAELNNKRIFAARGLETCRDLADDVWDEFMRQAITEIYQGQQEKIRKVKNECLDVVNTCYDEQASSLKDFSNVKEQALLGSRLSLAEEMCQQKLDACSNLYGGGSSGLAELLTAMHNITDQKIAKECRTALQDYAHDKCAVRSNDSLHAYPYACRVYAPGEQRYGAKAMCNINNNNNGNNNFTSSDNAGKLTGYVCDPEARIYTSCNPGYQMVNSAGKPIPESAAKPGNRCIKCSDDTCSEFTVEDDCGDDYNGSLYQLMVRYALQVCVRPSESTDPIPTHILADVNMVMDTIRVDMSKALAAECERQGGYWINAVWSEGNNELWQSFYNETGANTKWGYCANPDTVGTHYTTTNP